MKIQASVSNEEILSQRRLGLCQWFIDYRTLKPIELVCKAGHVHLWAAKVEAQLNERDIRNDPGPKNWSQLGVQTGRDAKGFTRYANASSKLGKDVAPQVPDSIVRHQVGWALRCDDSHLSPLTVDWVSCSTRFLILKYGSKTQYSQFTLRDFDAYADSLWAMNIEPNWESELSTERSPYGTTTQKVIEMAEVVGEIVLRRAKENNHVQ